MEQASSQFPGRIHSTIANELIPYITFFLFERFVANPIDSLHYILGRTRTRNDLQWCQLLQLLQRRACAPVSIQHYSSESSSNCRAESKLVPIQCRQTLPPPVIAIGVATLIATGLLGFSQNTYWFGSVAWWHAYCS